VRLTTYHPCSTERQEIRGLNLPGPPWAISTPCCGRDLYLYFYTYELPGLMNFKSYHEAEPEVWNNVEFHEIQKNCDQVRNCQLLRRSLRCGVDEYKPLVYLMLLLSRFGLGRNRKGM